MNFGPDGKLYVAVGENAVSSNAQTLSNRLGKMLRINTDGSIPTDNPFYNTAAGHNRAIWALGLRNPFTFAFNPGGPAADHAHQRRRPERVGGSQRRHRRGQLRLADVRGHRPQSRRDHQSALRLSQRRRHLRHHRRRLLRPGQRASFPATISTIISSPTTAPAGSADSTPRPTPSPASPPASAVPSI